MQQTNSYKYEFVCCMIINLVDFVKLFEYILLWGFDYVN